MAEPNGNYIEHCNWLLALLLSLTATHSFSSRSWRVILSGYANCDRRSERKLYRTLSLAACASAKCHLHGSTHSLSSRSGRVILSGWAKCDRVTETCLRGLFWKLSSGLRCNSNLYFKNVDNAFVGAWVSYCHTHSVTVSSVRYTKHCVDGQPSEHSLWHTLVTSCGVV